MDYKKLSDLIYPNITKTTDYYENKYKKRELPEGAEVTRFAPSPTGYMHIGHFFGANLDYRIAHSTSGGIFYFRLEDTDKKREVEGSDIVALTTLKHFGVVPDEGFTIDRTNNGDYGPYRQSDRMEIYQTYAKKLIAEGKAFPCFCEKPEGKNEVLEKREKSLEEGAQIEEKDPCRTLTLSQVEEYIKQGKKFCIRLKSNGKEGDKVKVFDLVRGEREIGANCKDVVLIKDNGIPPYAFAHAVDDHLMGTTTVVRGEEWISTWPQHIEIFNALGFSPVKYIHTPVLCKIGENGNKRKISKSKDPEADMRFYIKAGLPAVAVTEYLLNLLNSNFELWRAENPEKDNTEFPFSISKIGTSSPFYDMVKLEDISKNLISKMTAKRVYEELLKWAEEYNIQFANYMKQNAEYVTNVLNIDRETPKPRKDISKWSEVPKYFHYMFDYDGKNVEEIDYEIDDFKISKHDMSDFLKAYKEVYSSDDEKDTWFNKIKNVANSCGFAIDNKLYKQNPEAYKGNTADACAIIRFAVTKQKNSPDLYSICKLLGTKKTTEKIEKFIEYLK